MEPDPTELIAISLPARVWSSVDAEMDSAASLAAEGGRKPARRIANNIRRAGARQVPRVEDGKSPPDDQQITITLMRRQWRFALRQTEKSQPDYERRGDQESFDLGKRAIQVIAPHCASEPPPDDAEDTEDT